MASKILNINKNSTLATLFLKIVSLLKDFDNLHSMLALLNHYFNKFGIFRHKSSKNLNNINFNLPGYAFCYNGDFLCGTGFFI